jgi:hypothetical protein
MNLLVGTLELVRFSCRFFVSFFTLLNESHRIIYSSSETGLIQPRASYLKTYYQVLARPSPAPNQSIYQRRIGVLLKLMFLSLTGFT